MRPNSPPYAPYGLLVRKLGNLGPGFILELSPETVTARTKQYEFEGSFDGLYT